MLPGERSGRSLLRNEFGHHFVDSPEHRRYPPYRLVAGFSWPGIASVSDVVDSRFRHEASDTAARIHTVENNDDDY